MNDSETYEYESRRYVNPTLSSGEQMGFIDELRDTIGTNTAQINAQTQALGTDISPNYGGLTGSNNYFAQRYQTTPVQAQAATLKATAQAKALNDLLTNYQNQASNRYNQAYRSYQKNAGSSAGSAGSTGGSSDDVESPYIKEATESTENVTPPKEEDYYITGEEQTQRIKERSGLPEWLINVLKIFGAE